MNGEQVGSLPITRTYTCVTCGRVEDGTVVDGEQLRPMVEAGWQWWAGHGEGGVEIFACSFACWQASAMYEPRSEMQDFVRAWEELGRAILEAFQPILDPILQWLTWRLTPANSLEEMASWREWWQARTELSELIKAYAVMQIAGIEGLYNFRWHVTFDGRKSVVVPYRVGIDFETQVFTIEDSRCLKETPWGTLGYGYNEEHRMGVIFVAPEHAVDADAKNVSAPTA